MAMMADRFHKEFGEVYNLSEAHKTTVTLAMSLLRCVTSLSGFFGKCRDVPRECELSAKAEVRTAL